MHDNTSRHCSMRPKIVVESKRRWLGAIVAQRISPRFRASIIRGRTDCVVALVLLHQLPGLSEALTLCKEELTRPTQALDVRVFLRLSTGLGEVVARFGEQFTCPTRALHWRLESLHRVGYGGFALASL
jgi:hypothetical protein